MPLPTAAPACRAALAEATRLWPQRSRASDGILSSDAHKKQNPNSGHDRGNAFDLTHDPANGCDAHALAERAMRAKDERLVYVISNRRIWSRGRYAEGWRRYDGPNPHDKHAHFELDPMHRNSTWPWWPPAVAPQPAPWRLRRIDSLEVDVVVNVYELALTTDSEGRGWDKVPYPRSRIVGFTAPGIRPGSDGRYLTGEVGFADEDGGTVVSLSEWEPNTQAVITLSVVN